MKEVYVFCNNNGVSLHRLIVPYKTLIDEGYTNIHIITSDNNPEDIHDSILIFNRTLPDGWISTIQANNNTIVIDIDDDWVLPREHVLFEAYNAKKVPDKIIQHIKASDIITTTTSYLGEKLKKFNKPTHIFPNAIHKSFMFSSKNDNGKIKFGMVGSNTHLSDVSLLEGIADLPGDILSQIQFVNCGYGDGIYSKTVERLFTNEYKNVSPGYATFLQNSGMADYVEDNECYIRLGSKDIWTYMKFYYQLDYLLIPLKDSEFNRCKSPLKLAECAATNTIPIVSDVMPYSEYLSTDYCYKVSNNSNSWRKAIIKAVKNHESRHDDMVVNLSKIANEFDLAKINEERKKMLKSI